MTTANHFAPIVNGKALFPAQTPLRHGFTVSRYVDFGQLLNFIAFLISAVF
jgi:hypothetical protein